MVVLVSAALLVVYGVAFVASAWDGDGERSRSEALGVSVVFLILPGIVVLFTAYSARRRLTAQVVSARLFSILAGIFATAGRPARADHRLRPGPRGVGPVHAHLRVPAQARAAEMSGPRIAVVQHEADCPPALVR